MENKKNIMEEAKTVENNTCTACAIGAICLSDGPVPDFEIAGLLALYSLQG